MKAITITGWVTQETKAGGQAPIGLPAGAAAHRIFTDKLAGFLRSAA